MDNLTLYVYYKISANDKETYLLAIKQMNKTIESCYPHIKTQIQKRPHADAENRETWMETYTGFLDQQLEKLMADLSGLAEINNLPKERRYEVFVRID